MKKNKENTVTEWLDTKGDKEIRELTEKLYYYHHEYNKIISKINNIIMSTITHDNEKVNYKETLESLLKKLEVFQFNFNSTLNHSPTTISPEDYHLRYELLKEENEEYLEACENNDLVEIADALGDKLYIILGSIVSHGMQYIIEDVFNEIHRSNMSKLGDDGKPIINGVNGNNPNKPLGKILKSKNYFEPNLKQFL